MNFHTPYIHTKLFLNHFSPPPPLPPNYQAYENALGLKTVAWNPTGQLLALGSYDQLARVLNAASWTSIAELEHPQACLRVWSLGFRVQGP